MIRRLGPILAILLAAAAPGTAARGQAPTEPELARLKAHVETLASPAFGGRRGENARKAADYVERAFRDAGLEPLFDGEYFQSIPGQEPGLIVGRNVGARLLGSDPKLKDEWIVVSAHFDHLGRLGDTYFPGADDNASGTAMLLEAARCLGGGKERPRRSIMFVGFDLEEAGLFGSRYFAQHPPAPLDQIALFITADMIGRSLGGVCSEHVFILGTERIPPVRDWIESAARALPIKLGMVGTDILGVDRSDYGPFRLRKIPYLFFSTGENPRYHQVTDLPDTIDYFKLTAISRLVLRVVKKASDVDAVPKWADQPDNSLDEAVVLRDVFRILIEHSDELKIRPAIQTLMRGCMGTLDGIVTRGKITPGERSGILRVAQIILFSVL
jgi:Peptidase family M28